MRVGNLTARVRVVGIVGEDCSPIAEALARTMDQRIAGSGGWGYNGSASSYSYGDSCSNTDGYALSSRRWSFEPPTYLLLRECPKFCLPSTT